MHYILYLSAAVNLPDEAELMDILSVSRRNNTFNGLTGILLYGNGKFIQLLEGDKAEIQKTFERISADQRHKGIAMIASGESEQKIFPDWSMGFKTMNDGFLTDMEGYITPVDKNFPAGNDSQLPVKLLKSFLRTTV